MSIEKTFHDDNNKKRISNFFDEASIYVPNKYIVVMYGKYVEQAIAYMESKIYDNSIHDSTLKSIAQTNFDKWIVNHYDEAGKFIDLKWTCSSVNIPSVNSETEDGDYLLDAKKGIRYPLIKTHVKIQTLTMKIIEDRKMMMYQFFNALTNQFHSPEVLKPTSSFQKLGIVIIPLNSQEDYNVPDIKNQFQSFRSFQEFRKSLIGNNITSKPSQIFEFNSAVLVNITSLNLSNKNKSPLEYDISFKVPNTFQGSFNYGLEGLANNTSDSIFGFNKVTGEDAGLKANATDSKSDFNSDNFDYNKEAFEEKTSIE